MARPSDAPQVRFPPPLLPLAGLLLGAGLDRLLPVSLPRPPWLLALALLTALTAVLLMLAAVRQMRRHRTTVLPHRPASALLTDGVFGWSRNPIYLGFLGVHLACALALGSPGMLLTLPAVAALLQQAVIRHEEAFHARHFGTAWAAYRQRVRRWLSWRRPTP